MSCGKLIFSWALVGVGIIFMSLFEQAGVLMAVVPMGIAQNIRIDHDRIYYGYFRKSSIWQVVTAVYYLLLLAVSVIVVITDIRFMNMPLVVMIVMMMCPFFFIMVYGDIKICGQTEKE